MFAFRSTFSWFKRYWKCCDELLQRIAIVLAKLARGH